MKITKKAVIRSVATLVCVTVGGYFLVSWSVQRSLNRGFAAYFSDHELPKPDAKAWAQLKVGMTKQEVTSLLGPAPMKSGAPGNEGYWSYGYMSVVPVEHPLAFIVRFDRNGVVSSFRPPQDQATEVAVK